MATVRIVLAFLRRTIRISCWWKPRLWTWLAVSLWPVALYLPHHLLNIGRHPPVGTYIAILGGLAAAVTLRKEPPLTEKAAWIALISFVMVAEIRNLYVADGEQAVTFSSIKKGLDETKKGLDETKKGLDETVVDLRGVGQELTQVSKDVDTGVQSSTVAAAEARETINNLTGGTGFAYIALLVGKPDNGYLLPYLIVKGKYPLRRLQVRVVDYRSFRSFYTTHQFASPLDAFTQSAVITELGDVSETGTALLNPIGIDTAENTDKNYNIELRALNGGCREYLRCRRVNGKWVEAIRVVALDRNRHGEEGKLLFERIDPDFPESSSGVNWSE